MGIGGIQNDGLKKSKVLRAGLGSPSDLGQVILLSPWAKRSGNSLN